MSDATYTREELDAADFIPAFFNSRTSGLAQRAVVDRLLATARAGLADSARLDWLDGAVQRAFAADPLQRQRPRCLLTAEEFFNAGKDARAALDSGRGIRPARSGHHSTDTPSPSREERE